MSEGTPEFNDVASTAEVPLGRVKGVRVGERRIALYHTAHGFFASDNSCPHRGGPLAEGDVLGNEIICPWHLWGFDVETGVCTGNSSINIVTHQVRVEEDRILVRLAPLPETSNLL